MGVIICTDNIEASNVSKQNKKTYTLEIIGARE
jgi:hypothetical protein